MTATRAPMARPLTPQERADLIGGEDGPGHVDPDAVLAGIAEVIYGDLDRVPDGYGPGRAPSGYRLATIRALLIKAGIGPDPEAFGVDSAGHSYGGHDR